MPGAVFQKVMIPSANRTDIAWLRLAQLVH